MLNLRRHANPSGSGRGKNLSHAQRIAGDHSFGDYNPAKSHRHPTPKGRVKRYAELMGNHKNHGIKSLWDNKTGQAQVDSTTTTLTLSAMQSMYGDCGEGTEYPDLIIGDQDMFDRYHALLTPQQRFADEDTAKGGFKSLMFNGAPVVVDASAPSGDMMFLNCEYLDLYPHKDENFRMEPFTKPINQNVKVAKCYWMGVLAASNARRFGILDAITA